ncbi:MAG: hypothetical protein RLZZ136_1692 [Pseudomonadota bacterium]|jgi:MFS family permease
MADQQNTGENSTEQSRFYSWFVLGVLILAYMISFIDRQALTLLVKPIRASLHISDTQLSLLHGFAFALFYTIMGIPIGRMVDQKRRTWIIAIGIVVWSAMTAVCGLARNFTQMFLARIGVGVGEAALSPGAYSLLGDYFPPRQLPMALSIYTAAAYAGSGLAIMIGGALISLMPAITLPGYGPLEPWQAVFVAIALPGILVALAILCVREPARTSVKRGIEPSFSELLKHMRLHPRAYLVTILGYSLSSLMWNGALAWLPTFFIRTFQWTPAEVGLRYGLTLMLFGTAGIVLGGLIIARLRDAGRTDANLLIGLIALVIALPAGVAGMMATSQWSALTGVAVFLFGSCMPWGGAVAALQEITPNQMRGQVSAIYLFSISFVGLGFGPTVVAYFTDHLFGNDAALGHSLAVMLLLSAPLSAVILLLARAPYRKAIAAIDF